MQIGKSDVIVTFDDIIIENTYSLYMFLTTNFSFYNKYFKLTKLYNRKSIYERDVKEFLAYMYRVEEMTTDRMNDIQKLTYFSSAVINVYNNFYNKDVYNNMKLTQLGKTILTNPLYYNNPGINNICILVKYRTTKEKEFKEKYLKRFIDKNTKFRVLYLQNNDSYLDTINKNIKKWSLLITDDIKLVEDIAKNDINHKEFYLPNYGYTKASDNLKELIKQKSANITYYNAI